MIKSKILYRPKTLLIYIFPTFNSKCRVTCYPQQKWEQMNFDEDDKTVRLEYKNVSITIPATDFEKNWLFVGEKDE